MEDRSHQHEVKLCSGNSRCEPQTKHRPAYDTSLSLSHTHTHAHPHTHTHTHTLSHTKMYTYKQNTLIVQLYEFLQDTFGGFNITNSTP